MGNDEDEREKRNREIAAKVLHDNFCHLDPETKRRKLAALKRECEVFLNGPKAEAEGSAEE